MKRAVLSREWALRSATMTEMAFLDIFVTNFARDTNTLYKNLGNMFFVDTTVAAGLGEISLPYLGWGTSLADLDNDGLPDIFVANGQVYPQVGRSEGRTEILAAEGSSIATWATENLKKSLAPHRIS